MKRLMLAALAALMVLAAGCGGGLSPDAEVEGEIDSDSPEIGDELEDAEEVLLAAGRPVDEDWPCAVWQLSADGAVLVEVESDDFDPVLAVYDEDGGLLALCDDWEGELEETLVAMESVPEGATLMLFAADGDDGEFELACTVADEEDVEDFLLATDLSSGSVEGYKPDEKDDELLEEVLADVLEDQIDKDFANAAVYGFSVEEDGPVKLALSSDDFDPFLVLLEVDGDDLTFIDFDDDGGDGYNSAIMSEMEEGDYLAVVLSYSQGEGGDFLLEMTALGEEIMEADPLQASEQGVNYRQEVMGDSPVAYAYVGEVEAYVPGLEAFTPVAAFHFSVEEAGLYQLDGFADMTDVVLSAWVMAEDLPLLVDYNDDGSGTGTDSRLVVHLDQGEYLALVNSLSGGAADEDLGFSWQAAEQEIRPIRVGFPSEAVFSPQVSNLYYSFDLEEPGDLVVTADAMNEEIDPMIDLWSPSGATYSDDDGGEDFNSRLETFVGQSEVGSWTLRVTTYSGGEGRIRVRVEHAPTGESLVDTGEMPEPEEPPAEEPEPVSPAPGTAGI